MSANPNEVGLAISTMEKVMAGLPDQTLRDYPLTAAIVERGNLRKQTSAGGTKITQPVMVGDLGTFNWTNRTGTAVLDEAPTDHRPEWDWRYASLGFTLKKWDLSHNSGKERIFDVLKVAKDKMEYEFKQAFENGLLSAGGVPTDYTGAQGMPQIDGIQAAIAVTGTYGNINRATAANAWWRAKTVSAGTTATIGGFAPLMSGYQSVGGLSGVDSPDIILVPQAYFNYFVENKLFDKFRYTAGAGVGLKNLPGKYIEFMDAAVYPMNTGPWASGGAWVNTIALLNSKDWFVIQDSDGLKIDTIETYPGKNIMSQQGWWCGNVVCTRPRAQGLVNYTGV